MHTRTKSIYTKRHEKMSILTNERLGKHKAESTGEVLIRRQMELAKAVLPLTVNEAADATFVEAEDALVQLNVEAEQMIQERGKPTRKIRRALLRYARRLLEITDEEPDLLDPRSISLVAHASDATGKRDLLETTLEQAERADMSSDTDINLFAIEQALETDAPFSKVMKRLNTMVLEKEVAMDHVPLEDDYEYLFDGSIDRHVSHRTNRDPEIERPLFKD